VSLTERGYIAFKPTALSIASVELTVMAEARARSRRCSCPSNQSEFLRPAADQNDMRSQALRSVAVMTGAEATWQ